MAKTKNKKSGGFWLKALGVLVAIVVFRTYPIIFVIALLAGATFLGFKIWKKVKQRQEQKAQPPEPKYDFHTYTVKGVFAHEDEIFHNLMEVNPEYSYTKREMVENCVAGFPIYKWIPKPLPAELVPEPENPYDSNAVKILVGGVMIGHIPKESCLEVRALMDSGKMDNIAYEITGGAYKLLVEDYDPGRDRSTYTVEKDESEIAAKVILREVLN